jgi:hypothetical protein
MTLGGLISRAIQQNQINELTDEANSTVESLGTLGQQVQTERKRNDVQTARIKALSTVVEGLLLALRENGAIPEAKTDELLQVLRTAMTPVKL